MDLNQLFDLIVTILAGGGSLGIITVAVASYIGKIWAERYTASLKYRHDLDIEKIKVELDLQKEKIKRFDLSQFSVYNNLYSSLLALNNRMEDVWEAKDIDTKIRRLTEFSIQLDKTKKTIEENYLLIEEEHYIQLLSLINEFFSLKVSKSFLLEHLLQDINTGEINDTTVANFKEKGLEKKERLKKLFNAIRYGLKCSLRS